MFRIHYSSLLTYYLYFEKFIALSIKGINLTLERLYMYFVKRLFNQRLSIGNLVVTANMYLKGKKMSTLNIPITFYMSQTSYYS